jgi:LPS-assembly protein
MYFDCPTSARRAGLLAVCLLLQATPLAALPNTSDWRCRIGDDGRHRCESALPTPPAAQNLHAQADLDWWSLEDLTDADEATGLAHCPGLFIEPPPVGEEAAQAPENAPLRANADNANLLEDQSRVQLEGNVSLQQGYRQIRADQLDFFRDEDRIELSGNIMVREPGILLRGESAEFNPRSGEGTLKGAAYVLHEQHAHGRAEQIRRSPDGIVKVSQGSYTYCPPGSEDWQLRAEKIRLDADEGRGVARDAKLRVGDVPVLYTPYLSFPMDDRRLTGFLWPHLGYTADSGADVSIPYYLNLAPNYDLTLIPRYIGDRGVMATAEGRYLNSWSEWLAAGSHLADDDEADRDRWLYNVQQSGRTPAGLSTRIDYTEVSDDDYFQDLSNGGLSVRRMSQLNQLAQADYRFGGWNVQVKAQEFQTLDDDLDEPYQMLPRIELAREFQDRSFKPDYRLLSHFTRFDEPSGERVTGDRLYAEPGFRFPMHWTAGFLVPTLKYRHVEYDIDVVKPSDDESPSVSSAVASLDGGLFFERESELLGRSLLQTLEPRLYYLWADREDHQGIPDFDTADLTFSFSQLFRELRPPRRCQSAVGRRHLAIHRCQHRVGTIFGQHWSNPIFR